PRRLTLPNVRILTDTTKSCEHEDHRLPSQTRAVGRFARPDQLSGERTAVMACPIIFWELGTRVPELLGKFYAQLFDWQVAVDANGYRTVHTGSIDGGIYATGDIATLRPVLYVMVDDVAAYLEKAQALGGQVLPAAAESAPAGGAVVFRDP